MNFFAFRLHKEGKRTLILAGVVSLVVLAFSHFFLSDELFYLILILAIFTLLFLTQFFRNPKRPLSSPEDHLVYCPADGKVVVIEEIFENEYFNEKKLQISIFMSPVNVHINRNPVSGKITYFKYHPGKFLFAWAPKASDLNERTSMVYSTGKHEIMMKQIAGAVARRIIYYIKKGDSVKAGDDMGFIKFGSRVDIILPLGAKILVSVNQMVKGNVDILAELSLQ